MFTFDETVYEPNYGMISFAEGTMEEKAIVGGAMPKARLPPETRVEDLMQEDLATCFLSFLVSLGRQ